MQCTPRLVIPGQVCDEPADADLLDIKIEDLCYATREDGQGFVFVEPKGCDDVGYDTSASLSPLSNDYGTADRSITDHDWLDSPSSVDSLLSSCKDFCEATDGAPLTFSPQQEPQISLMDIIPQQSQQHQQQQIFPQDLQKDPNSNPPLPVIQSKPIIPTLLMFSASSDSSTRYTYFLITVTSFSPL